MDTDAPGGGALTLSRSHQKPGLTIIAESPVWLGHTHTGTRIPGIIQVDGNASWTGTFYAEPLVLDTDLDPGQATTLTSDISTGKHLFFVVKFPGGDPGPISWTIDLTGATNAVH